MAYLADHLRTHRKHANKSRSDEYGLEIDRPEALYLADGDHGLDVVFLDVETSGGFPAFRSMDLSIIRLVLMRLEFGRPDDPGTLVRLRVVLAHLYQPRE